MLPNFLVIGATRSGTTSLHHYLGQHPEIFVCPINEPNFFVDLAELPQGDEASARHLRATSSRWIREPAEYEGLFDGVREERAIGEVSPFYLHSLEAPRRIAETLGQPKLIAILRHPVDRMYGAYMGGRRDGHERRADFAEVIRQEVQAGIPDAAFGSHVAASRYDRRLRPYFELFPRERIGVWLFDDFQADPGSVLRELFRHLGVDDSFAADTTVRHNPTGIIRHPLRRFLWTRSAGLRRGLRPYLPAAVRDLAQPLLASDLVKPALDPELRRELLDLFREDIRRLEDLLDRDLGRWLD